MLRWLLHKGPPKPQIGGFEEIASEARLGDVILVAGRSRASAAIKSVTQSQWTHAALCLGLLHGLENEEDRRKVSEHWRDGAGDGDKLLVEGVLGQGVVCRPLRHHQHEELRICRPSGLRVGDAQQVARFAVSQLGAGYDWRQLFDLMRLMTPWALLPRRWRSSLFQFNMANDKTICSTMIAEAFAAVQFPILPLVCKDEDGRPQLFRRSPKVCIPADFDHSPYFQIIKPPFYDVASYEDRALTPWSPYAYADAAILNG